MQSDSIRIFQIYFSPDQLSDLDQAFIPYDNSACRYPDEREFYVFKKEYALGTTESGITGFLSWKFSRKTHLTGREFIDFCKAHPGYDVYFVNPFPAEVFYGNVWQQGELWHPGIKGLAQRILDDCGHKINLDGMPNHFGTMAFCNFWAGKPLFWRRYMEFCLPIYNHIQNGMSEELKEAFFKNADPTRAASHFAFFFERLFSTFLHLNPDIRSCAFRYSKDQLQNLYTQEDSTLIDELYELEAKYPNDPEPIMQSQRHLRAMADRAKALATANTFPRRALYQILRALWHTLPFKDSILKSSYWRTKTTRTMYRLTSHELIQRSRRTGPL